MTISHPTTPLVAILRGLQPTEAVTVAQTLFDAGFRALEVPLNRPGALECIASMVKLNLPGTMVGGGTMLNVCLLYTSPSPRDGLLSRMPSSA